MQDGIALHWHCGDHGYEVPPMETCHPRVSLVPQQGEGQPEPGRVAGLNE